jgi:hypothetical protein
MPNEPTNKPQPDEPPREGRHLELVKQDRPPLSKRELTIAIVAIIIAALVPVGAAFGFDVCRAADSVGVSLDTCLPDPALPGPAGPEGP